MMIPDEAFYSTLFHITDIQDIRDIRVSGYFPDIHTAGNINLLDDLENRQ
jgi:hypothetical protein